ncbi:MAG TPA: hypothetical protein VGN88_04955 [Phycisphaerae bacterium]
MGRTLVASPSPPPEFFKAQRMIGGLASGLGAAFFQSLSFLGNRYFAHSRGAQASRQLLVLAHIWMGIFSAVLLAIMWPGGAGWEWIWKVREPLLQMTFFYLIGQMGITLALRHAEPSRVSPLMGLKTIFLAGLSTFLPQPQLTQASQAVGLTGLQWAGVGLSLVAAIALNYAGTKLRKHAIWAILLACTSFAFADWNIARTNVALKAVLPGLSTVAISFLNVGLCYFLAGVVGWAAAPWYGSRKGRDWADAVPFAAAWFAGMLCLYWCYAEVGPLLGVILQSTRGLMSILMGSLLVYWGHLHLEPINSRKVFIRRFAAGALMCLSVTLYVIGDPKYDIMGKWHLTLEGPRWKASRNMIAGMSYSAHATCAKSA